MRALPIWLPMLLLSTMLLPLAAADADAEPSTTVWDEPRAVVGETIVVEKGERLVIRGTTVTFEATTLQVEPGGELVVESTRERAAELIGLNQSWKTSMYGDARILGYADKPVRIEGIGGIGTFQPEAPVVNFRDGFTVAVGNLTVRHAEFINYSSGLFVGRNATAALSHVVFSSPQGAGLISSTAHVNVTNARFEGAGGNIYVTLSLSPVTLRNVSLAGSQRAILLRDSEVLVEDATVTDSLRCIEVVGGRRANVTVDGLRCHEFKGVGIHVHQFQGTFTGNSTLRLANVDARSSVAQGNALAASDVENLTIVDSTFGPLPAPIAAIAAEVRVPDIRNVTFRDVGGWNVYLIAPDEIPREPIGTGDAGQAGWQVVTKYAKVTVLGARGSNDGHAHVRFYRESNASLVADRAITADGSNLLFEVFRIDAEGKGHDETFLVIAEDEAGRTTEVRGFDPSSGELVINMENARAVPGGLAWALAGLVVAALVRRGLRKA